MTSTVVQLYSIHVRPYVGTGADKIRMFILTHVSDKDYMKVPMDSYMGITPWMSECTYIHRVI